MQTFKNNQGRYKRTKQGQGWHNILRSEVVCDVLSYKIRTKQLSSRNAKTQLFVTACDFLINI